MHSLLFQLLIFCSAAIVFVPLFTRLGLGSILAYLFSGLLVGPMVLGWIKDPAVILHFSQFGVVFLQLPARPAATPTQPSPKTWYGTHGPTPPPAMAETRMESAPARNPNEVPKTWDRV